MLTIQRSIDGYGRSATLLIQDGVLIAEIILRHAHNGVARLSFNLSADVEVVRADAMNRPGGPSEEWLNARALTVAYGDYTLALPCEVTPDEVDDAGDFAAHAVDDFSGDFAGEIGPDGDECGEEDDEPVYEPDWTVSHPAPALMPTRQTPQQTPAARLHVTPTTGTPAHLYTHRRETGQGGAR
jgi:hypothetical protein